MLSHLVTALVAFTAGFLVAGLFAAARRRDEAYPRPWPGSPGSGSNDEPV